MTHLPKNRLIAHMRTKIHLIKRTFLEDEQGQFIEKFSTLKTVWGCLTPLSLGPPKDEELWNTVTTKKRMRMYHLTMRNFHDRNALQEDLFGLICKGKVMRFLESPCPLENGLWVKALVIDYGVKENLNG